MIFCKENLDYEPCKIVKFTLTSTNKWVKSRNEAKIGLPEDDFDEEEAGNYLNRLVNCFIVADRQILLVTMFSTFLFDGELREFKQVEVDQIDPQIDQLTSLNSDFGQDKENFLIGYKSAIRPDDSCLIPSYALIKRRFLNSQKQC